LGCRQMCLVLLGDKHICKALERLKSAARALECSTNSPCTTRIICPNPGFSGMNGFNFAGPREAQRSHCWRTKLAASETDTTRLSRSRSQSGGLAVDRSQTHFRIVQRPTWELFRPNSSRSVGVDSLRRHIQRWTIFQHFGASAHGHNLRELT
jgi:hypothetical protein